MLHSMTHAIRGLTGAMVLGALSGPVLAAPQDADPSLVERGQYLATAGDCAACHSDPDTGTPYAGGYAVNSPLGAIYGSNITPSKTDGIGSWSLKQFETAVRKGRAPGEHFLYPAMPYTSFAGISDADMKALYSYFMLKVSPVDHAVPETDLSFPFNIRPLMAGWDMLFAGGKAPAKAPEDGVARGKYLVETVAHCSTCHTPRNALMAEKAGQYLGGGKVGSWVAPNITSDKVDGIGSWSQAQLEQYLKTGAVHGLAIAAGEMGTAVEKSFSHLSDSDIHDIAAYIKTVPAISDGGSTPRSGAVTAPKGAGLALETGIAETDWKTAADISHMSGGQLYEGSCASCHGANGAGTPDHALPALAGSSAVGSSDPSNLIMTITDGVDRTVNGTHVLMPAFHKPGDSFEVSLTDGQIAKVADYVATTFGPSDHHVTTAEVKKVYASATQQSWLIAHAATLIWIAIVVVVLVILAVIALIARRKGPGRV